MISYNIFIYDYVCQDILKYNELKNQEILIIITGTIIALSSLVYFNPVLGQNNSLVAPTNLTQTLVTPDSGIYMLHLVSSGGIAPTNVLYTYDKLTNDLIHISADGVTKKTLNETEIKDLNEAFQNNSISNINIFDTNACPDCKQRGLSYGFVDPYSGQKSTNLILWHDGTSAEGVKNLMSFIDTIERIQQVNGSFPPNPEPGCTCPPGVICIKC